MSYDPSAYRPDQPPEGLGPPDLPPLGYPDTSAARARVQLPAMFLMIVGGLNLLVTVYFIVGTVNAAVKPAQRVYEEMQAAQAAMEKMGLKAEMEKKTPDEVKNQALLVNGVGVLLTGLCALLSILGGWRMYRLRSYGLSVVGAVAAAIPCLSGSACCGVGEVVGLWAIVVLLNQEVREAFR
jgi:hypothetical protein